MKIRSSGAVALLTLTLLSAALSGCQKSCREEAVDEMADIQKERIAYGGEDSISGYFNEQQAYADSQCADDS